MVRREGCRVVFGSGVRTGRRRFEIGGMVVGWVVGVEDGVVLETFGEVEEVVVVELGVVEEGAVVDGVRGPGVKDGRRWNGSEWF